MKLYLIVVFIILSGVVQAQESSIIWEENKALEWTDFTGKASDTSKFDAECYAEISYNYTFYDLADFEFDVHAKFHKNSSWSKKGKQSAELLKHEQLHFDIAEYYARKLATAFANYTFNSSTIKQDFNTIYTAIITEYDVVDNTYDYETEHSKNKKQQEAWNKKIAVQLLALTVPTSAP